ncbi:unnamed protein product [Prorocentrum cordatum]|uniref:beta-glucosidase n=1 Tax=Prorocentrum cordatum TaxID=2364126 RepID=A0ABN9QWD8_9DINO|nr:unnamed protein product [Polarella glacialis]
MCAARVCRPGARLLAAACALRGAGALGVRSGARLSHREEPAASSEAAAELGSAAAKAEYAMTWEAAAEKAHSVASAMTPEDQFRLVGGLHNIRAHYYIGNTEAVEKFGIPALRMQDSSNGFRTTDDEEFNTTTHWPSPLALGATWDVDLIERVAEAIGAEFKQKGANVVLGPSLNVHRVAANGRNFDNTRHMAGEDPYLGSRYAAPYIRAVQRQGLIATAKHFAFNEQETNRYNESSDVDAVTAWNLYYPPFEAAVQSGIGAFMCSYNRVNGTFACGNEDILKRDLRDMMGFKGFVMTDWMAGHSPTDMLHGLSQEMTVGPAWFFNKEKLSEFGTTKLTEATAEILTSVYRLGLDREKAPCQQPCTSVKYSNARSTEHTALAREAATASLVLLKNDRGLLPLRAGPKKRLAIVGLPAGAKRGEASWSSRCPDPPQGMSVIGLDPNKQQDYWACLKNSSADYYGGGGSGSVVGPDPVTPAEAIQERAKVLAGVRSAAAIGRVGDVARGEARAGGSGLSGLASRGSRRIGGARPVAGPLRGGRHALAAREDRAGRVALVRGVFDPASGAPAKLGGFFNPSLKEAFGGEVSPTFKLSAPLASPAGLGAAAAPLAESGSTAINERSSYSAGYALVNVRVVSL